MNAPTTRYGKLGKLLILSKRIQ